MNLSTIMIIGIYVINLLTIVALIFIERKNITVTYAWILILSFIPVLGFILYFMVGSRYKLKILTKKYSIKDVEYDYKKIIDKNIEQIKNDEILTDEFKKYKELILLNANNSLSVFTGDNNVRLFKSAKEKYEDMFYEIENAKESIHLEYFIFKSKDCIGKDLLKLLSQKAKEGVKVKVIYDRLGSSKTKYNDFKELIDNGGVVLPYLPSKIRTLITSNYRLHRKIVVIDNKYAYTGGINIGDDYLSKDKKIKPWRDTSIKIIGTSVNIMQLRFLCDWYFLLNQTKKSNTNKISEILSPENSISSKKRMGVQIVSSGPDSDREETKDLYIKMITDAKKYIYIETPYFIPDDAMISALEIAVLSGIDVRIIIPGIPDKKYVYNITLSYIEDMINKGIKVYLYNGFIHSKSLLIDDEVVSIGSCNLDIRSFMLNYEINTVVYNKDFAIENKELFFEDISNSKEIKSEDLKKKNFIVRIKQAICRFIAPLS